MTAKYLCGLCTSGVLYLITVASLLAQSLGSLPIRLTRIPDTQEGVFFVKASIPVPATADIYSTDNLYICDKSVQVLYADCRNTGFLSGIGQAIPAQFEIISRWNGTVEENNNPAKWVLAEFPLNLARNSTNQIFLESSPIPIAEMAGLVVTETPTRIRVETGRLTVVINKKKGNLFQLLKLGDYVLADSSDENGFVLRDRDGIKYFTYLDTPSKVEIEKNGTQVVTICVHGGFKNEQGKFLTTPYDSTTHPRLHQPFPYINYSLRYHFYNDQDYLNLEFTLENNGAYGILGGEDRFAPSQWLYFDELYLIVKPQLTRLPRTIYTVDYSTSVNNELFEIYQNHTETYLNEGRNFSYRIAKNGVQVKTGERTEGWIDINDGTRGVVAAVQNFWQNADKKISWQDGILKVHLWPAEGKWPFNVGTTGNEPVPYVKPETYQFEGGRHKTHTILFRFYDGVQNPQQSRMLVESFNRPLFGIPPPEWTAITGALPLIAPAGVTSSDPAISEALSRYEQIQRSRLYLTDAEPQGDFPAATLYTIMEGTVDYSSVGYGKYYGWMNYGDLYWADGYCSTHYDWTYSMLLHFLRTGKEKFFDMGEVMARHQYDIDHYWGSRRDEQGEHIWVNSLQRYESGYHGNLQEYPHLEFTPKASHSWISGLMHYYLMSGDRQALAAAREFVEGIAEKTAAQGIEPSSGEIRFEGWTILNLLQYYNATGEKKYYDLALKIGKEGLLAGEQKRGGRGYWGEDDAPDTQSMVMYSYVVEPIILLHHFSKDEAILNLLKRMANWLQNECITGGKMEPGGYAPLGTPYDWVKGQPLTGRDPIRNLFFANLFGYLYLQTHDQAHLDLARQLFCDSIFWYQAGADAHVDPASRSAISMLPRQYPGSYTKIHGWTGRSHQVYLHAEWQQRTGVEDNPRIRQTLRDFYLAQNFPNPFLVRQALARTMIPFGLSTPGKVNIEIYNLIGQRVAVLIDSTYLPGHYEAYWNGRDMSRKPVVSGTYWVKMKFNDLSTWQKLQVVR